MNREQLTRGVWAPLAACLAVAAISIFVVINWFGAAFPEASIEFRYDRASSLQIADGVLASQHIDTRGMKHSATFDSDDEARIFLERSLGLKKANEILKRDVRLWAWSHRWFRPLQEEEFRVDIAPTGEVIGFSDRIPEDRAINSPDVAAARAIAERFLGDLQLRLLLGIGIAAVILVTGTSLNSFPSALAGYNTTESYPAFLARFGFGSLIQGIGVAMMLVVVVGAGEVLFRERLPKKLSIARICH